MKLILTQPVDNLGAAGDVVDVKDGYARNFLIPRNVAIVWTRGAEKQIDQIKRARDARAIRDAEHANEVRNQLQNLSVNLPVKAGDTGKLFGSVTANDVADAIKAAGGPLVERRSIELGKPIKTVGSHKVAVKLHPEVSADVTIEVVAA